MTSTVHKPKYVQIAEELQRIIKVDGLRAGDRLPSVAELSARFETNHNTVSAAVKHLADKGLVESRKRGGIVVRTAPRKAEPASRTLAFLLDAEQNPFGALIIKGAAQTARLRGYRLLVADTNNDVAQESEQLKLIAGQASGILAAPVQNANNRDAYSSVVRAGVPLIFVDTCVPGLDVPLVATDHAHGAALAARHLVKSGCDRIYALLGSASTSMSERREGFASGLESAGLQAGPGLVFSAPENMPAEAAGYALARRILRSRTTTEPIGIFVASRRMAVGVYAAAKESGFRIGHDVRMVAFGDDGNAMFMDPPLTAIRQDPVAAGARAGAKLIDMIEVEGESITASERLIPELIVRHSCRPTEPLEMFDMLAEAGQSLNVEVLDFTADATMQSA